jgi:UDP-glucose 4-epimerase
MKHILVTGGCGYIGSHTVVELYNNGYKPIILDNNSKSNPAILKRIHEITGEFPIFYPRSCQSDLYDIFENHDIEGIIHFAAYKSVGESVIDPISYYDNNINGLLNILTFAEGYGVNRIVFSSSCSLYGNLTELPARENSPLSDPESPYAYTKLVSERILSDFAKSNRDMSIVSLRYFNPVGAHESGLIGESPIEKPSNIVPIICRSAEDGELIKVFGSDYPTRDGSCIRDYIHVMDLANAHIKSLDLLYREHPSYDVFNVGSDLGISVFELINTFERVNGVKVNYEISSRREGDVMAIYSDSTKSKEILGWFPTRTIEDMVSSAWKWHKNRIEQTK